jgi:hypothetical protein
LGLEDVQVTWGGAKPEALAVAENWGDPAWLVDDYRGLYYLSFIEDYNPIIYPLVLKKIIHHNLQMDLNHLPKTWKLFGIILGRLWWIILEIHFWIIHHNLPKKIIHHNLPTIYIYTLWFFNIAMVKPWPIEIDGLPGLPNLIAWWIFPWRTVK